MNVSAELESDAKLRASLLEDLEKFFASYSAEAVSAGCDAPPVDEDVDVVPVREVGGDCAEGRLVGGAEVLQGLVGEDDSPSEGIVSAIPFEDGDVVGGICLFQQECGVEAGRSAADDDDFQEDSSGYERTTWEILYA